MWHFLSRVRGLALRRPQRNKSTPRKTIPETVVAGPQRSVEQPPRRLTVSVEGNIGSGKSTFIQYFGKLSDVDVVPEPVEKWRNLRGHNLFKLMYDDPGRWAHAFQSYVQLTMIQSHLRPPSASVKLMERSIHSARYIFVENMYRNGIMSEAEFHVYNEWYRAITQYVDCGIDLMVYLRTDPELVHSRVKDRARDEEQQIPLDYFKALHQHYEDWIFKEKYPLLAPVLIIDANDDLSTMYSKYKYYTRIIRQRTIMQNVLNY